MLPIGSPFNRQALAPAYFLSSVLQLQSYILSYFLKSVSYPSAYKHPQEIQPPEPSECLLYTYTRRFRPDLRLIPEETYFPSLSSHWLPVFLPVVCRTQKSLCSHTCTWKPGVSCTPGSFWEKNADLFSAQSSRANMTSGLVTFV